MSELENRLEVKRVAYRKLLPLADRATTELGRNAAKTNLIDLANEILKLEMYISDADRLARGEDISIMVNGNFTTWVQEAEDLWELLIDHALQVKNELAEEVAV